MRTATPTKLLLALSLTAAPFAPSALAADFTIPMGTTETTQQGGGDDNVVGIVAAGATLDVADDAAVVVDDDLQLTNDGTIASGNDDAVIADKRAQITNAGTITGTDRGLDLGDDAVITNTGTITGVDSDGIRAEEDGSVTNDGGRIEGDDEGVQLDSGAVTNLAGGLIVGSDNGIGLGDAGAAEVTNAGTIRGTGDSGVSADGDGILTNQGGGVIEGLGDDGVDFDGTATIDNSGSITGSGAPPADPLETSEGVTVGGGTLTNHSGATITGSDNGVYFVISASDDPQQTRDSELVNEGSITGTAGYGVRFFGDFDDRLTNDGGSISGGNGTAVDMAGGNDTVTLLGGGTISGDIDGGAGDADLIDFTGGTFTYGDDILGFEQVRIGAGSVELNGQVDGADTIEVLAGAVLGGNAGLDAATLVNAGTLAPGSSTGTLSTTGDYEQTADGSLVIEILSLADFDRLVIDGTALLDGLLALQIDPGFNADLGESLTFLTAADIQGGFAAITGAHFGGDRMLSLASDGTSLSLRVTAAPLPGVAWLVGAGLLGLGLARRAR